MNHRSIINLWPSLAAFSADVAVPYPTAASWKQRNSIPPEHWALMLEKARERRIYVTHVDLINAVDKRRAA